MAFSAIEELLAYFTETYITGVIESNLEQRNASLIQPQNLLEDFTKFDRNDAIFQEYDPPSGDNSKMGWKRSRPAKWRMSLWKAMKCVFYIQILGGLVVGSLAIAVIVLDFNSSDLCFDSRSQNWTALPGKIQAIIVSGETVESYVVQLWAFFLVITMFGWPLVKKLNLLTINLLGAFLDTCYRLYLQIYGVYETSWMPFPLHALFLIMVLMNSILVGREIANNSAETERYTKLLKTIKVSAVLAAHMVFGMAIAYSLVYRLIPLYSGANETQRLAIATAFPLVTVIPKIIVRLAVQRVDFLHPGETHVLVSSMYCTFRIVFRGMQAELSSLKLFILLSFVHASLDLLERLTIIFRDYSWYFIYRKLKRDTNAEAKLSARKFRTPRSMRFIADMSIQMILGESTALIAAVGLTQLHSFMYSNNNPSFIRDMYLIEDFFVRVSIALTIDLLFNSFSLWLQMSYFNIAVVRVWKKKWRKHMAVGLILTSLTMCYFTTHLFAIVKVKHSDKHTSRTIVRHLNCTGPFSKF